MVTVQELENAKIDARTIGESVNENKIVTPRYGAPFKSMPMIAEEMQSVIGTIIAGGVPANIVLDGNQAQDEINLYGGKKYDMPAGGYLVGGLVRLDNGDIVKSTVPNNTVNPNVDMTGWIKENSASQIFDQEGVSLQDVNNRLQAGRVYFSQFGAKTIEQVAGFDCTSIFQMAMYACAQAKKQLCINVSGTYKVNAAGAKSGLIAAVTLDSAYSGLTVVGEGDVVIKAIGTNDDFFSMFKILNAKNIEFQNIMFDGNGTKYFSSIDPNKFENAYSAFYTRSDSDNAVENLTFYQCHFKNTGESAVTSYGSSGTPLPHYFSNNINFVLCGFENIGAHGIGSNEWKNSRVQACDFKNIGMKRLVGIVGSGLAVDFSGGCEDCVATINNVDGAGGGFKAETHTYGSVDQASKRITFSRNTIKNLWSSGRMLDEDFSIYYGIRLNAIDCIADDNTIESFSHAIWFGGKSVNSSAVNNKIRKTSMPASDGIFFENSADTYGGNSASLNVITNCIRNGINLQGNRNSAWSNKISGCGVGGVHINYARNAVAKCNECFNNTGYGIRVSKKTETASVMGNDCYDTRPVGSKTQTTGIQVAPVFDEASNIQVQANNVRDNATSDYSMSDINTYTLSHYGFKEVFSGSAPLGGLWKNADRILQSFYAVGRIKGWVCSVTGGASRGVLTLSTAVTIGHWWTWHTGTTAWEVTITGTTAATTPDITGKVVGDTIVHGTATLTLRSLTTAAFVSEGVYA